MVITRVVLKNWRNFPTAEFDLRDCTYLIGPNASGKSNLLDAFRFLRDLSKPKGGGLQYAVANRGGMKKLRCLHARQFTDVSIEVHLAKDFGETVSWIYKLAFKKGDDKKELVVISQESVIKDKRSLLIRPDPDDKRDRKRLAETHLEQSGTNEGFRDVAEVFGHITYLHLVPLLLKSEAYSHPSLQEEDPFGQGFLEKLAGTSPKTRSARLKKIEKALKVAVPNFDLLRFVKDDITGAPHLEALYSHHRPQGAWQREDQFSDGTLRLLGILWSLLDGAGVLLIEEPELSLNVEVVKQIPVLIDQIQRKAKIKRQVILTTHSEALLENNGIDPNGVVILDATREGTEVRPLNKNELTTVSSGFSLSDVVLKKTAPKNVHQMSLF